MSGEGVRAVPLARIAIWGLTLGALVIIALILGGSEDLQGKVGWASLLFLIFSVNSLAGFLLIERRPELTSFGGLAIGLSVAAYFVVLVSFVSHGFFSERDSIWLMVSLAVLVSQASMLLAFRRDEDSPLVIAVLVGSLVILAVLMVLSIVSTLGAHIGPKVGASLGVLYLLSALLPPCLRWAEIEEA